MLSLMLRIPLRLCRPTTSTPTYFPKKKKKNRLQSRPRTRDHIIPVETPFNLKSYCICETFRKRNNTLQDKRLFDIVYVLFYTIRMFTF